MEGIPDDFFFRQLLTNALLWGRPAAWHVTSLCTSLLLPLSGSQTCGRPWEKADLWMSGHVMDYFLGTVSAGSPGCPSVQGIQHLQLLCVFSRRELLPFTFALLRWWTADAQLRVSILFADTEG